MKCKAFLVLASVSAAAASLPVAAQTSGSRSSVMALDSGFYVGGSIGRSKAKDACAAVANCDDTDTAWRLLGGYRFNRNFSTEVGYHDFGKVGAPGADVSANAWEWVGIGALPVGPVSLYAKAGLYRGEAKGSGLAAGVNGTNTTWTTGLGVQYDLTRQFGARAEWQRYPKVGGGTFGNTDVDVLSLGGVFRFQ